ncbi:aquaporin [Elysia marginata]|uniref:Aquaporin n=1 Tax=Elysia marginata TaxID=1093978 RepID=A0AAV4IU62_9GAST|nr:aquaporin [Elysia marginata]
MAVLQVYWAGPIVGGVVAGLLYEHLFAMNASITKVKACMLTSDYDDEKYRAKKLKVRIIEEDNDLDGPTGMDDNGSYPLTEKDSSPA